MRIKKSNFSNGFTLIELMITTSIVGVLASVAIPTFDKFLFDAREMEGTRILLDAYRDQKRVAQDCDAGRFVSSLTGAATRCTGTKFTEIYETSMPGLPSLMYRAPENANFELITGGMTLDFQVDNQALYTSKATPLVSLKNSFGYGRKVDADTQENQADFTHFMMGAEATINGQKHLLAITEVGTLLKICDARTGGIGPDAGTYQYYAKTAPTCVSETETTGENEGGNNED